MGFSHLFILQLRSWHRGLAPPDLDSRPDLFDLLIFNLLLQHLLAFDLLPLPLYPWAFRLEPTFLNAQALQGDVTSYLLQPYESLAEPSSSPLVAFNGCARMTSTSTSIDRARVPLTISTTGTWLLQ